MTATSMQDESIDHIVSVFGLKTLSDQAMEQFALEVHRVLKPGGTFSLLEISLPKYPLLRAPYNWYLSVVVPLIGKMLLGNIECYRLLGRYTQEFGSCERVLPMFRTVGLTVAMKEHFFGCSTSLVGFKNPVC
jgi:demethylmenaquinone methyltransferase/2-methoxy-6-polyprenyl-1,4-benzoquinol methylase